VLAGVALIVIAAIASATIFDGGDADAVPAPSGPTPDVAPATSPANPPPSPPPTSADAVPATTAVESSDISASAPPSTSPRASDVDDAGLLAAREVLAGIPVELEDRTGGYNRDLFAVWIDADGDGCDTRDEVLLAENLTAADSASAGCIPIPGLWRSAYDSTDVTDPTQLDVDHLVSLKEAWDSGAWSWTPERRIAYANDLTDGRTLVAVSASSNRSKGDRDPSNWLPEDEQALCQFVGDWIAVKARWSMSMDQSEHGRLGNLIDDRCPGLTIEPWPEATGAAREGSPH
jgi:hypothetical protein